MARRNRLTVLTTSIVLGIGMTTVLAACTEGGDPAPTSSASGRTSASPGSTASGSAGSGSSGTPGSKPSDDQTGAPDDGTGPGTGNGSGVDNPTSIDWTTVTKQGLAAAGGGTVVSLTGAGDSWTVVVVGSDGSETQSVVSATLGRVTSGPFPKSADAQVTAPAAALKIDAATAAADAEKSTSGAVLSSLVLGGTGAAPVWTATLTVSGAARTVTVDGLTGATTAS